jgi:hypothetical protein
VIDGVRFPGRIRTSVMLLSGILLPCIMLLLAAFPPRPAYADGISGSAEFSYSLADAKIKTGGVVTDDSKTAAITQRYILSLSRSLYPFLRVSAGGLFDTTSTDATINGANADNEATLANGFANLTLGSPFVSSAVGYSRNQTEASSSGFSAPTEVLEVYNGRLGLHPEGLPALDFLASRSNAYDTERLIHDSTSDFFSLNSRYQPIPTMNLGYAGSLSKSTDHLGGQTNESLSNTLQGTYTERFFANRVSFATNAILNSQETKATIGVLGQILDQRTPLAGFFAVSDVPTPIFRNSDDSNRTAPITTWTLFNELIQNARITPITYINLGFQLGDTQLRNMGLDLGTDPATRTVDTIHVYIALQGTAPNQQPLPASITNQFSWDVYTSDDNQNWQLHAHLGAPVQFVSEFDPQLQSLVSRFVLTIPQSTKQFIKVVTRPLPLQVSPPPGFDVTRIYVCKLEGFQTRPATSSEQKSSSLSGLLNTAVKVKLLDRPGLPSVVYDLNFNYNFSSQDSGTRTSYFISNALSTTHRFSSYLRGYARVTREDSLPTTGAHNYGYTYSASLEAVPLSTLRHNLIYSGKSETTDGKDSTSNSIFLTNTATLYQGISAVLSGGVSKSTSGDGSESLSTTLMCSVNLTPHPTLNLNAGYTQTDTERSGGGIPDSTSFARSGTLTATFNPLSALYLFGSVGFSAQNGRETVITENFGGSWSPFRDGALQLSISYNENLSSTGDQRTTVLSPTLRWNIRSGWWLDVSYSLLTDELTVANLTTETEVQSITSTLRLTF